jgi:uncharacterized protein
MEPLVHRLIEPRLEEALSDSPVVLIHGARQSGKTTVARKVGASRGYSYLTFDDDAARNAAIADPIGFVAELPERVILDEVQRVPGLFTSLKVAVDRERVPGRFLLTGSSNILMVPSLTDSLAGRLETVRLYPFAQCEIEGSPPSFIDTLFSGVFGTRPFERLGRNLSSRIVAGGFPAALARTTESRRAAWYQSYVQTVLTRDVLDLMRVDSLDVLPKLLALTAGQTARLLNFTDLCGPFQLSRPTIRQYVRLLEQLFLIDELQPWFTNQLNRLIKTPKLHIGDTGIAAALLEIGTDDVLDDRPFLGQLLESFIYRELKAQASAMIRPVRLYHFRDKDSYEVDYVLESGRKYAGVEVKASSTVTSSDFAGLRRLAGAAPDRFAAGVLLYDGEIQASFGEKLFAVPIRALWERPS